MPDAAADMLFHRAFGKAQLSRGFPLRQALHLAQDEGFAAFGRKLGDGVGDEAKLLALFRLDVGRQVVRPEAQPFDLAERVHRHDWRAAHFGRDDRQGGAEEIGARIFDMIDRRQASELGIMRTYVARQPEGPAVLNRSAPSPRRSWLINEAPAQIRRIGGKIGA